MEIVSFALKKKNYKNKMKWKQNVTKVLDSSTCEILRPAYSLFSKKDISTGCGGPYVISAPQEVGIKV
jgi:hypothetical protein